MATVAFASLDDAEIIEVEFVTLLSETRTLKLLVDTGFTGQSSFVLSYNEDELIQAMMASAPVSGAIQGEQNRAWVSCRIPQIEFQETLIAIMTDLSALSLPDGIQGMAGLSFLRSFTRWGAERARDGWRFHLSNGNE